MRWFVVPLLLGSVSCRVPPFAGSANRPAPTENAYRGVLDALGTHQILLLGESHRSSVFHHFLRELVQTTEFAYRVNDIVVEFGNARYQPILDRYIAGDSVPRDSLRLVWRNTTQLLAWDSPLYEEFFATIRQVNAGLPRERKLRVLAGDPPIDWRHTQAASDIPRSYGDRDIETLRLIEREVIARHRKAMVVIGGTHNYRYEPGWRVQQPPLERASLGDQLNRLYPGRAYIIDAVFGDSRPALFDALRLRLMPNEMTRVRGTSSGESSSSLLFGTNVTLFRVVDGKRVPLKLTPADYPPLEQVLDALIYFGRENPRILAVPEVYQKDPAYVAEIRRRIGILTQFYGVDIWTEELNEQLLAGNARSP